MEMLSQMRARYSGKVFAFVALPNSHLPTKPPFVLCVAVLGEPGYSPLNQFFDDYNGASNRAEALNKAQGYDAGTAIVIVADTMQRSQSKEDAAEGLTSVKLEAEEIAYLLEAVDEAGLPDGNGVEDQLVEKLEAAREETAVSGLKIG